MLAATTSGPAGAELLGDTIKPFASATGMYDSNVFRVKDRTQLKAQFGDDQLADFITVLSAGTGVRYAVSQQELNLLLKKDFILYSHYTDQNSDRDEASGSLALTFFDRVKVRLDGTYAAAPESRVDYRSSAVNTKTELAGGITAGYEMTAGVGYEAGYRRSTVDYSLPQFRANEYVTDRYWGTVSYRPSVEARLYASLQREYRDYQAEMQLGALSVNNNSVSDSIRIGINKTFSPKTSVACSVGYLERRHSQASARDFDGVIGSAELRYGLSERLGLVLNGERQLYEETYTDRIYSVNELVGAGLVYQLTTKLRASLFDRVSWKRFQDAPGAVVAGRSDRMYEMQAGLEWTPLQRLSVTAGYRYSSRSSTDSAFDFTDHTAMSTIAYRY